MTRAHTAWLKAAAVTIPNVRVFVSTIEDLTKTEPPYVVIHPAEGVDTATRASSGAFTQNPRFTVHSVGVDADQAAWVGEQLKKRLVVNGVGVVPTITGELCDPVWWSSPLPIQVDKDVLPWVIFHVAECGFSTYPSA